MLWLHLKPAITSQYFLDTCADLVTREEFTILKGILEGELPESSYAVLKQWSDFEGALKNELVRLRSGRKRKDPARYLRQNNYWSSEIPHIAMAAYKNTSILEAERILDSQRWRFLDNLSFGHYFDFEFLIIYALKLRIIQRWERIRISHRQELLERALN